MLRYLSGGVSTLVSLMAAHRAVADRAATPPAAFGHEEIAQIDAFLACLTHDDDVREGD